jgi:predicted porin
VRNKLFAVMLAAPGVALAQSSVTVSGSIKLWYEVSNATGASNIAQSGSPVTTFDLPRRDRIQDGNASNIRFTAVEDVGSGLQGFIQVESAVLNNANTRNDAAGNASQAANGPQTAGGWATRNSGVGLRSQTLGEVLIGVWDVHYNEQDAVDYQQLKGPLHSSVLGVMNTIGAAGWATGAGSIGGLQIGARYSNVIRYQSPSWSGINFRLAYARPSDNVVPTAANTVVDGAKNKVLNAAVQWNFGPITVGASGLRDADVVMTQAALYSGATVTDTSGAGPFAATVGSANAGSTGTNLATVTSGRFSAAYLFPFGLRIGYVYDRSKLLVRSSGAGFGDSEFKRSVWALPFSYSTGAHTLFATYAQAARLNGAIGQPGGAQSVQLSNVGVTPTGAEPGALPLAMGSETGARFYSVGYQYDLSKRTNLHLNFTQIKNDKLAGYDFYANGVGMGNGNFGADPTVVSLGLRHAF